MRNEAKPCPGFDAMLEEFQDLFADWAIRGYPSADFVLPGGNTRRREKHIASYHFPLCLDAGSTWISITATYAQKPGFIFSSSTIDSSAVAAFCKRNKLEYRIASYRDCPETLFLSGTPQNFLNSELNGRLVRSRERARSLASLAQKFYHSEVIRKVHQLHKKPLHWFRFECRNDWIGYKEYSDYNREIFCRPETIFDFNEHGYRELQSEDECIAFTLALFAYGWGIEPLRLDWSRLLWNIKTPLGAPQYNIHCPYTDPPPQPAPKPTYKDFF